MNGTATQSSTFGTRLAENAIDGNLDTDINGCATTVDNEAEPWWQVDLQENYVITRVATTTSTAPSMLYFNFALYPLLILLFSIQYVLASLAL